MDNEITDINQTNLTEQKQQSYGGLVLRDDTEGQKALAVELYDRFHAMKTFGKEPESLESITRIFKKDLWRFTAEEILEAISTHSQRSQEFPTVADITGLIKRKGKPPIRESDIIAIRKKDGEFRTRAEWDMLRLWDAQQQEGWDSDGDEERINASLQENIRLRKELATAKNEIFRLNEMLRLERLRNDQPITSNKPVNKIERTVQAMKEYGAKQSDIDVFLATANVETATNTWRKAA